MFKSPYLSVAAYILLSVPIACTLIITGIYLMATGQSWSDL